MQVPDRSFELGFGQPQNGQGLQAFSHLNMSDTEQEGSVHSSHSSRRQSVQLTEHHELHERLDTLRPWLDSVRDTHPDMVHEVLRHALDAVISDESFNGQTDALADRSLEQQPNEVAASGSR